MMSARGADSRKYFRSVSDLEVWYAPDKAGNFEQAVTKEFSATGLSFTSHAAFTIGSILRIRLHLKDTQKVIETRAFIIRTTDDPVGHLISIQFYDIDYHDFITLLDYSLTYQI